jgi:hypothetical protein
MELILTAIYTAPHKRVAINFMSNNEHEFKACGEVSEEELTQLIAAEGADVNGWQVELQ